MLITYHFKNENNRCYKYTNKITVKKAKEIFNELHKNDNSIIKVWLTHFRTWHENHYKTLKDIQQKEE